MYAPQYSMTPMIVYFREMESDFGILPVPKLDEDPDLVGQCVASQTMDTFLSQYEGLKSYITSSMNMTLPGLSK